MILTLTTLLSLGGCAANSQRGSASNANKPVEPMKTPGEPSGPSNQTTTAANHSQPSQPVSAQTTDSTRVIATVNGRPITEQQLMKPLIEGYGLNILLSLGLLEEAKNLAQNTGVKVTQADIDQELDSTLRKAFPEATVLKEKSARRHIPRPRLQNFRRRAS